MENLGKIDSAKDLVTKEWVEAQDFLPSSAFTKTGIKNALGISDWALAASKPSYNFSEIGSKPTTLAGYGITNGVIYSNNIDVSSNASFKHIGYGYANKGWWDTEGPSMAFGAHDGTYVKLSFPNYNEYYQNRIVYQHRRNGTTGDWIEIITKKTIGEYAVRISNQGGTLLPTHNESVCTFVAGKNGWKATGAAMIVNAGGVYTGLFNFQGYNTSDLTKYPRLYINVNHDGVVGQWAEVLTDKNIGTTSLPSLNLNGETISSWDEVRHGWTYRIAATWNADINVKRYEHVGISGTLTASSSPVTFNIENVSPVSSVVVFRTGNTLPTVKFKYGGTEGAIKWEDGIDITQNLSVNTGYRIEFDGNFAMVRMFK